MDFIEALLTAIYMACLAMCICFLPIWLAVAFEKAQDHG